MWPRSRPSKFASVSQAVEWCVRSGQVRNHESARVSMPGQVVDQEGRLAAVKVSVDEVEEEAVGRPEVGDAIMEEGEGTDLGGPRATEPPAKHLTWRVDLARSEPHWQVGGTGRVGRDLEPCVVTGNPVCGYRDFFLASWNLMESNVWLQEKFCDQ